jgi:hypothetical protein
MASKKGNSRLSEVEAQKRAVERGEQRKRRWQQILFIAFSAMVLISMIISLFVQP